jgi:hypothetical protein
MDTFKDIVLKAFEFYKMNNFINDEIFNIYEELNINKIDIYEFFESENDCEILSFIKLIQKLKDEKSPCIFKDECIICYENKTGILTSCNHFVCFNCYLIMACKNHNVSCPMCRRDIMTYIFDEILFKLYRENIDNIRGDSNDIDSNDENINQYQYYGYDDNPTDYYTNDDYYINEEYSNYLEYEIEDIDEWSNNVRLDNHY